MEKVNITTRHMRRRSFIYGVGLILLVLSYCKYYEAKGVEGSRIGFVQSRGTQFVVINGDSSTSTFLFNGFNSYWMMIMAAQPSQRFRVTNVFREAVAAGLSVCRTWAFNDGDGDHPLQISPGIYNEQVFQGLDFVISEARRYGIRLILSLSNNYQDYGGRTQYVKWAASAGVPIINGDDDFYTNAIVKGYYKNHVKKVLTRVNSITRIPYRDDPTIMAWELINEPRCQTDYSGQTINGWVQEMATYLKSIDKKHLLGIGMEGFYGDSLPSRKKFNPGYQVGTDFITNNLVKQIDFATIHAYPDIWLSGESEHEQMAFLQRWMTSHWTDSRMIVRKPLVFSEFGKSKEYVGFEVNERDSFLNTVYSNIYELAGNGGGSIGGGLVWQIVAQGMESFHDGYQIVLSQDNSTFHVIYQQSKKMAILENVLTNHLHSLGSNNSKYS